MEQSKNKVLKAVKQLLQDLTYTAEGDFTSSSIDLKLCLPNDNSTNQYGFESYDLSSINTNAILLHLKQSTTNSRLRWSGPDLYDIAAFSSADHKPSQYGFDFSKDTALILVFHEDNLSQGDIGHFIDNIDDLYDYTDDFDDDRTIIYWPASLKGTKKSKDEKFVPRVVGMTIIRKRLIS